MRATIDLVLDGLRFPAQTWQIIVYTESYGLETSPCLELRQIPMRQCRNPMEVASVLISGERPEAPS